MDWDDFKFFSAVVRHGTVRAAAKALDVHPSTVTRRIEHFEKRLGVKLFKRRGQSLVLTSAGAAAVGDLDRIERELSTIEHALKQSAEGVAGWVRASVPDYLLLGGLLDSLGGFLDRYPDVWIEWTTSMSAEDPADLALVAAAEPPLDLIARELGAVGWSLYAKRTLLARSPGTQAFGWIEMVGLQPEQSLLAVLSTLRQRHLPQAPSVARCAGVAEALSLARAGVGAAALPCLLGDQDQRLGRLHGAEVEAQPLWLLMAPENRRTRRVRALVDHLLETLHGQAERIRGNGGALGSACAIAPVEIPPPRCAPR